MTLRYLDSNPICAEPIEQLFKSICMLEPIEECKHLVDMMKEQLQELMTPLPEAFHVNAYTYDTDLPVKYYEVPPDRYSNSGGILFYNPFGEVYANHDSREFRIWLDPWEPTIRKPKEQIQVTREQIGYICGNLSQVHLIQLYLHMGIKFSLKDKPNMQKFLDQKEKIKSLTPEQAKHINIDRFAIEYNNAAQWVFSIMFNYHKFTTHYEDAQILTFLSTKQLDDISRIVTAYAEAVKQNKNGNVHDIIVRYREMYKKATEGFDFSKNVKIDAQAFRTDIGVKQRFFNVIRSVHTYDDNKRTYVLTKEEGKIKQDDYRQFIDIVLPQLKGIRDANVRWTLYRIGLLPRPGKSLKNVSEKELEEATVDEIYDGEVESIYVPMKKNLAKVKEYGY